jgi:hypothetical protein
MTSQTSSSDGQQQQKAGHPGVAWQMLGRLQDPCFLY